MELLQMIENRRSVRTYTGETIPEEIITQILQAGLLAPSGRSIRPSEFIVVRNKEMLKTLSECRPHGPQMLAGADAAIVVVAKTDEQDVWIEDASITMTLMHLMADSLGVGSCWIQGRLRMAPDGRTTEEYLREKLGFPNHYALLAILSLGMPASHPAPRKAQDVDMTKVHTEQW